MLLGTSRAQMASPAASEAASLKEREAVRSMVLPDLRAAAERAYRDRPTGADLEQMLRSCRIVRLHLGAFPGVIAVEWSATGQSVNKSLVNLYRQDGKGYRRIYAGEGFGPYLLPGRRVPDLVFGWTLGVCHERYHWVRFVDGKYAENGCLEHVPVGESCRSMPCGNGLPVFPDPLPVD